MGNTRRLALLATIVNAIDLVQNPSPTLQKAKRLATKEIYESRNSRPMTLRPSRNFRQAA